jgi:hypothetical protein
MSLQAQTASLVPFTSEVEARRIREKIRLSYGRPKFVLNAPAPIENVNGDDEDNKDVLAAAISATSHQHQSNPELPVEKEAPEKKVGRRRGGRKLRYIPLVLGSFESVDSHQDNEDKGDPLVAAGHIARREMKQFTALPPPQRKADKLEPPKKKSGRRQGGGVGEHGDDDGSDGEEQRRKKEAVVAESTSAQAAEKR